MDKRLEELASFMFKCSFVDQFDVINVPNIVGQTYVP